MSTYTDYQSLVLSKNPQGYVPYTSASNFGNILPQYTNNNVGNEVIVAGFSRLLDYSSPKHGEANVRWTGTGPSSYTWWELDESVEFGTGYRTQLHLELWFRQSEVNAGNGYRIRFGRSSGTSSTYASVASISNGVISFNVTNAIDGGTTYPISTGYDINGEWHHLVLRFSTEMHTQPRMEIFLDGTLRVARNDLPLDYVLGTAIAPGFEASSHIDIDEIIFWSYDNTTEDILPPRADIVERYQFKQEVLRTKYYASNGQWTNPIKERHWVENPARYVRWSAYGNTLNAATHFVELQVFDSSGTNVALGTTPVAISQSPFSFGPLTKLTNGIISLSDYVDFGSAERAIILFDLGQVYNDLDYIQFHHYWSSGRGYYDVLIEISEDNVNWKTAFESPLVMSEQQGGTIVDTPNGWISWDYYGPVTTWNGTEWVAI